MTVPELGVYGIALAAILVALAAFVDQRVCDYLASVLYARGRAIEASRTAYKRARAMDLDLVEADHEF